MIDLNFIAKRALDNAELRSKNGGKISTETRKMLKHTATEVIEATESYTFYSSHTCFKEIRKRNFESELADIICCVLIIARKEEIDIEKAVMACLEKNKKRAEGKGDKL